MSEPKTHELKILPQFFQPVLYGNKPFEVRVDDRSYEDGDVLLLREWAIPEGFTGREIRKTVTYILSGFGMQDGYVCMGLGESEADSRRRFEAWISAPPFERSVARHPNDYIKTAWPGVYRDMDVDLAWQAWQEARK